LGSEEKPFDQGFVESKDFDKITRRIPDDEIEKWQKVVQIPHGKKGAYWTGAHMRSQSRLDSAERSLDLQLRSGRETGLDAKRTSVQHTGKNCVANSVRNLFPNLTLDDLFSEFDENVKIGMLSQLFRKKYKSLVVKKTKGLRSPQILSYLTNVTTTGKYLLPTEKRKHCIAVDCDRRLIMESDPEFPAPLSLNLDSFANISVVKQDLSKLYRVIQK
jgi:hypothetical protein